MGKKEDYILFGGEKGWKASDWTASDDRVRGGKSQSYLDVSSSDAHFNGILDIKTLGGAGFASQRTSSENKTWDLANYDGIQLNLGESDGRRYTFIVKDKLLPKNLENDREQATISYEYNFEMPNAVLTESSSVFVKWDDFTPTYRGKERKDAPKLDKKSVKRFSIMLRSFFGDQEGDFSLTIKSIKAASLSEDLEKGSFGKEPQARPSDNSYGQLTGRPKATRLFGWSITVFAACLAVCYWIKGSHSMWPWQ